MTNAELAILGLIAEKPRHGYQIEQTIEDRGMREWTEIGFSSIYYLLKKLEKQNLIHSELQPPEGRGPARRVYHITPAGAQTWYAESIKALSNPQTASYPFMLGLSSLPALSIPDAVQALQQYADNLTTRKEHLLNRWNREGHKGIFHVDALFDYSRTLIQAELDWITAFIDKLQSQPDRQKPG